MDHGFRSTRTRYGVPLTDGDLFSLDGQVFEVQE
jgi:hypothetical protein